MRTNTVIQFKRFHASIILGLQGEGGESNNNSTDVGRLRPYTYTPFMEDEDGAPVVPSLETVSLGCTKVLRIVKFSHCCQLLKGAGS